MDNHPQEPPGLIGSPPPEDSTLEEDLVSMERELADLETAAVAIRRRIAVLAPQVNESFYALMQKQDQIDDWLADPQFDADRFVSDMRRKVDALRYVVEDLMKSRADGLKETAKPIQHKSQAIANNRERLRAAIVKAMVENHFQRVPGIHFAVRLRDSNPSLVVDRPADVSDYERFPGYVKRTTAYSWDTDRIRNELKAGIALPKVTATVIVREDDSGPVFGDVAIGVPARLEQSQWPEFVVNVPEKLEPKPKKAKGKKV